MDEVDSVSTHAIVMAELAEAITHKIDKFLMLQTEYAELLASPAACVKPIDDILSRFGKVASQGLLKWKKSDVANLQSDYKVFFLKLKVRTTQRDATNVELRLYQVFSGPLGEFFETMLEDMRLMTEKRDRREE